MVDDGILQKRIYDAVERWTVFRLVQSHIDSSVLERLKSDLLQSLKLNTRKMAESKQEAVYNLSMHVCDLLENLNVEVDTYSCDRIAVIFAEIYLELLDGRCDVYQRLTQANVVDCGDKSTESDCEGTGSSGET